MTLSREPKCQGKIRHETQDKANAHMARLNRQRKGSDERGRNVYYCRTCKGFHVGHKRRRKGN